VKNDGVSGDDLYVGIEDRLAFHSFVLQRSSNS
jgi:hypothetical protein